MKRRTRNRGFSVYRRSGKGNWVVAWTDGHGAKQTRSGFHDKGVAEEFGRLMATEADRVRSGVVDKAEAKAIEAGRKKAADHVKAWGKDLVARGVTEKYATLAPKRATKLLEAAKIERLSDITLDAVQSEIGRIAKDQSARTAWHYRTTIKGFTRWCWLTGRLRDDPLKALKAVQVHAPKRTKYPLTPDELGRLLSATESRETISMVPAKDRAMLYRILAYTGFRLAEGLSLAPESFDLAAHTITVEAMSSKRRRKDVQPITVLVALILQEWLKDRPAGQPVFPYGKWVNWRNVFRADCKAAGITAPEGMTLGVHSLRRFYITQVARSGNLFVAQTLARHSDPRLTRGYMDLTFTDLQKGLEHLPAPSEGDSQKKETA